MLRYLSGGGLFLGLVLLASAGFSDWEGRTGFAGLALTTIGGVVLASVGGVLLAKSFKGEE